jgi:hypothetical protein
MAQFHITQTALTQAINGTTDCANNMRQTMSGLEANLAGLTSSGQYVGAQQVAFAKAHMVAQDFGVRLNKDLDTMTQLMAQTGTTYGSGDQNAHDLMLQLANAGPDAFMGGTSSGLPGFAS